MIRKVIYRAIVMVAAVVSLGSCARVQEACGVVAEADSLRAVGQAFTDSVAIADAAETLYPVRLFFPTDYAHANYYYGRLLREHGNHPAAMEAFLRTVHSRTRDNAIKGRAYCNMGIMAGWGGEHILAYDIYNLSATQFLLANDSVAFFYALNDMAYEKALNKDISESLSIINRIESECNNGNVLKKIWETRAIAYLYNEDYDSTIYCVNQLLLRGYNEPTGLLLKAKAFSFLNVKDSAVYYAQLAMSKTNSWFDINNAYYILANDDEKNTKEEALQIAGDRADIQKLIEIRRGELGQATQILEQDLNLKPDLRWLYAIIGTLLMIAVIITFYLKRKRRQHMLYSQQVEKAKEEHRNLSEQNKRLQSVHSEYEEKVKNGIEHFCQRIKADTNPQAAISWDSYSQMCRIVNANLFNLADKLDELGLVEHEIRFCVLVLLQFNRKECAQWMNLGVSSMGGKKRDIAKKLGQTSSNLYDFLLSLALK